MTDAKVSVALLHHPVYDKNLQEVVTAVTNLDIHDIARSARTFGLFRYYVVTPVAEQQDLVGRISRHWVEGWGASYNPMRRAALELVRVLPALEDVLADLEKEFGRPPKVVVTGAKGRPNSVSCRELTRLITETDELYLLLFGTGWGLTEEVFARADLVLEPIKGPMEYNHLSVRSAAAIIFDRLLGER